MGRRELFPRPVRALPDQGRTLSKQSACCFVRTWGRQEWAEDIFANDRYQLLRSSNSLRQAVERDCMSEPESIVYVVDDDPAVPAGDQA